MKLSNIISLTWLAAIAILAPIAFSGCAGLDNALLDRQETVTQRVEQTPVTNQVVTAELRAAMSDAGIVTTTTNLSTNLVVTYLVTTNFVTNTVFLPKPQIAQVAGTVQTANSMLNPTPSAPLVNLGIEGLLAGLAAYAGFRNKQYATAAKAMITGIQKATEATPALAPIKDAILDSALNHGVSDLVQTLVDKHTRPASAA